MFVSEPHEIQMGRHDDSCLIATRRFMDDSVWQRYVQELGLRLAARSERAGLPWTFRVLDDPVANAFAFPGGFVYVTRGLLAQLNSEAQLAAVVGHEIGHVAARHVADQGARRELERLGLVAGTAGGSLVELYGDVAGTEALLLANSRQAEEEADVLGVHYMSEAGYDPAEMVAVLRALDGSVDSVTAPAAGGPLPEWLATHPRTARRIEDVTRERETLATTGTRVERDAYLARVGGLVYGPDLRPGYFQGHRFVVPARGYQFTLPPGWWVTSAGTYARGISPAHDAAIELRAENAPTADSAARSFFAGSARPNGREWRPPMSGFPVVQREFAWFPYWVRVRGEVAFIESRGTVYRLWGFSSNGRWSAYEEVVQHALRSLEAVPDSEIRRAQPLRIATFRLQQATSVAALFNARGAPVGAARLAALNQVPQDSVLPPGYGVKWVEGPAP